MAQLTSGLRTILSRPWVYDLFQNIAGAKKFREIYVSEYLCLTGAERVLDLGCGTASILSHLPETIAYVGVDISPEYIEAARSRFQERGVFLCRAVDEAMSGDLGVFDLVLANGLLHHLNDSEVARLCSLSSSVLAAGGRLITHDPCYCDGQAKVARYLIERDRGRNVRSGNEYVDLLRPFLTDVRLSVRHDMANIPYSHAILIGRK